MRALMISLICLFCVHITPLEAAEQNNRVIMSIQEVKDLALSHNLDLAAAALEVQIAEVNMQKARAENLINADPIAVKRAELAYMRAHEQVELTKQRLLLKVEELCYNLIKLDFQLSFARDANMFAAEKLKVVKARHQEGLATEQDVLAAEITLLENCNQLQRLKQERELVQAWLLMQLNLPFDREIEISDQDFPYQQVNFSDDLLTLLKNHNSELHILAAELDLCQLQQEIYHGEYTPRLTQQYNNLSYAKAKLIYEQRCIQLYLQAQELLLEIDTLAKQYQACLKSVALAENNLAMISLRCQEGLVLPLAVTEAELELKAAQYNLLQALLAYNLAAAQLYNFIGISR